jgi:hypothetical protein
MSDDIYPNDGSAFDTAAYAAEPEERIADEVAHASMKAASYPILGDVAGWFEEQLAQCDSIDNIQFDLTVIAGMPVERKLSVEAQVLAYRMLKELLNDKYREFEDFRHER